MHALLSADALVFDAGERFLEVGGHLCEPALRRFVSNSFRVRAVVLAIKLVPVLGDRNHINIHQGVAAAPVRRRSGADGGGFADSVGFPACSHALVMTDATPLIASLIRFSQI